LNAKTTASTGTVRFLAALAPAATATAARQRIGSLRRIDDPGWTGVGGQNEQLLFRQSSVRQIRTFDSWATDAEVLFLRGERAKLSLVSALGATTLRQGNETWFASERPASFVAAYEGDRMTVNVYSTEAQTVRVRNWSGAVKQISIQPGSQTFQFTQERNP
jgi:hypothetical protein